MKVCPYCYTESGGCGGGDEFLDYCDECELIIEGSVIDVKDTVDELDQLIIKYGRLADEYDCYREYFLYNKDFHDLDEASTSNPVTAKMYKDVEDNIKGAYQLCLDIE